jgi:hypothetical protein
MLGISADILGISADILGISKGSTTRYRYPANHRDHFISFLKKLKPPVETICKDVSNTNNTKTPDRDGDVQKMLKEITDLLERKGEYLKQLSSVSFEKDDDTNQHINFVTACANIRATNYHIDPEDRLATKGLAGRIIPAIATTTSVVSGLSSLELYKIVYGNLSQLSPSLSKTSYNTISRYRYGSFNLGIQMFGFGDSMPANQTLIDGNLFTVWTRLDVDPDVPLSEIDFFDEPDGVLVTKKVKSEQITKCMYIDSLFDDDGVLYSSFDGHDNTDKLTLRELISNRNTTSGEHLITMSFIEAESDEQDYDNLNTDGFGDVTITLCVVL